MPVMPAKPLSSAELQLLQRKRKRVLVAGTAIGLILVAVTNSIWRIDWRPMHRAIQGSGLLLILFCILGRTWSILYIGGHKKRELITKGPYSVVRNPLYVFTLFGAAGIGALFGSLALAALTACFAWGVFVLVTRQEEHFLRAAFPTEYPAYAERVPRLLPRLSLWEDADQLIVIPRLVRRTFLDASLFLLAVPLVALKALLRDLGWLPTLLLLP